MKAVVDRFEDNHAVLLLYNNERIQFTLPREILPEINEGDIIDIEITKNKTATYGAKSRSKDMIERLNKKYSR
jgi:Protein of unknown function (DUF3006)